MVRLLFVTMELAEPIFSGNGVYGRTIVEALLDADDGGHTIIDVLCAAPAAPQQEDQQQLFAGHATLRDAAAAAPSPRLTVRRVLVPVWGKVAKDSAWEAFAVGAATACEGLPPPDLIVGVDWTAAPAVAALQRAVPALSGKPVIHMNFRVFFAQVELLEAEGDVEFYTEQERAACGQAARVIALTRADAAALQPLLRPGAGVAASSSCVVLNPPVRSDVLALAAVSAAAVFPGRSGELGHDEQRGGPLRMQAAADRAETGPRRRYVTCCARLSEEKRIDAFVSTVEGAREALAAAGLVPLLIGAPTSKTYADVRRPCPPDPSLQDD
jgi:glycosyltransferase involved in cell wall biosynthesis